MVLRRAFTTVCNSLSRNCLSGRSYWSDFNSSTLQSLAGATRYAPSLCVARPFHASAPALIKEREPSGWLKYNELVFPPTRQDESPRPAEIYHQRAHLRHSYDKVLYLCRMIRGMSVEEACKQLTFKNREAATTLREMIEEAQDMAVREHNVEFRTNLWIAEAFPKTAGFLKGMRKHGRPRFGIVHYRYTHIFLKLREGKPPQHYYPTKPTGHELKASYIEQLRRRRIMNAL